MHDCYFFSYLEAYAAAEGAVRAGDVDELARLEQCIEQSGHAQIRRFGLEALRDARARLPQRSREHLARAMAEFALRREAA